MQKQENFKISKTKYTEAKKNRTEKTRDTVKQSNKCIINCNPRRRGEDGEEAIFELVMAENFLKLMKDTNP